MLGQQFGTILARTDPFDVAQGLERYIRSLTGEQVRFVVAAARSRMNEWYRGEFLPLLDDPDDERVKNAFARILKSNLRAIPLFGPAFCEGVISQIPAGRIVGVGEEGFHFPVLRPALFAIAAIALVLSGAAAQRVLSSVQTTAQTPTVIVTPTAIPVHMPPRRVTARTIPAPATARPASASAAPPSAAPASAAPAILARAPREAAAPPAVRRTPPAGSGVKTIVAAPVTPEPSPAATAVDTTDMPQSYSDATPLPRTESAPPAQVSTDPKVATPTPGPNRFFLHQTIKGVTRTISHLNPFKPHPQPTPSPYGPNPQ